VSEYASWSTIYYNKFIQAALAKAGAPADLVQFVTGYGEAGSALVTGGELLLDQACLLVYHNQAATQDRPSVTTML
jgi:hypothetical protein